MATEETVRSISKVGSITDQLTQIWQRVLQLPTIGPEDNFFDIGGDSALAVQLFLEIEQSLGRQFPPVMIYHVPTIATQTALLEQPSRPEFSPLVLLKKTQEAPTLFIAPGLGGGPAEFFQLVRYVQVPCTIFGLQPKGIEGFDDPSESIEDMAQFYLRGVRRFQPHGPYYLAGYSLGGLVAMEMARTLLAEREPVALVLMIDSYPHINYLSTGQQVRLLAQRAKARITNFGQPERTDIRLGGLDSADEISTFAPSFERVRDAAYLALKNYQPTVYPGHVQFIRAAEVTEFPEDPVATWSGLVAGIQVETVPGDHLGMLTTHYETLASALSRYLEAAVRQE